MVKQTGDNLIYGVTQLFGIVVAFIIFSMVFSVFLIPAFKPFFLDDPDIPAPTKAQINTGYNNITFYLQTAGVVFIFVIIVFLYVAVFRRQAESRYQP